MIQFQKCEIQNCSHCCSKIFKHIFSKANAIASVYCLSFPWDLAATSRNEEENERNASSSHIMLRTLYIGHVDAYCQIFSRRSSINREKYALLSIYAAFFNVYCFC